MYGLHVFSFLVFLNYSNFLQNHFMKPFFILHPCGKASRFHIHSMNRQSFQATNQPIILNSDEMHSICTVAWL